MPEQMDRAYHEARAEAERQMATDATDPAAETIHLELARNHDLLASGEKRETLSIAKPKP